MKIGHALTGLAATAVLALGVSTTPAAAAATTAPSARTVTSASAGTVNYRNERTQPIAAYPSTNALSCQQQHLYITGKAYSWVLSGLASGQGTRNMVLASGWYTWTDCLQYDSPGWYLQTSTLDPDNPAYATAGTYLYDVSSGGSYYWGSYLAS